MERLKEVPTPIKGDVIWFTDESMNKIYKIFGATNEELMKEHSDLWDMAVNMIKNLNGYTDNIGGLSATSAVAQVMSKATLEVACGVFSIPMSNIPDKYLVTSSDGDSIRIGLLNKGLYFPEEYRARWDRFKVIIPSMSINRNEYPHFVMGHNY